MSGETTVRRTDAEADRIRRRRNVDNIWNKVEAKDILQRDFFIAADLFREALRCYENLADSAAVLMCRVCVETAVYTTISRKRTRTLGKRRLDFDYIHTNWALTVCKAKEKRRITKKIENMLKPITRKGNYVAHIGQKFDQKLKGIQKGGGLAYIWIRPVEAEGILRKTAEVLNLIRESFNN